MGIAHRWLLVAAAVAGVALILATMYGRAAVTPTHRQAAPTLGARAAPTPSETWRPPVKVDWKKHPAGTQARIDRLGAQGDCDGLSNYLDIARDPALAGYLEAWFDESGLCIDVYQTEKP